MLLKFATILCLVEVTTALVYPMYAFHNLCGKTKDVSAPKDTGSAGVLVLDRNIRTACTISLKIISLSSIQADAIYLNIKDMRLPVNYSVEIYENVYLDRFSPVIANTTLVKRLEGGPINGSSLWPSSVAQLRSSFAQKVELSIRINGYNTTGLNFIYDRLVIDFNILRESSSTYYSHYCDALEGYTFDQYLCDEDDRVNCPSAYNNSQTLNPALSAEHFQSWYCDAFILMTTSRPATRRTTTDSYLSWWSYPTQPSYYNPGSNYNGGYSGSSSYSDRPNGVAVAGAIIGSIGGLVFFGALVQIAYRRQRMLQAHQARRVGVPRSHAHPTYTAPVVVSSGPYQSHPSYAPPPPQPFQTPLYMDAPPSYSEVQATPTPVSSGSFAAGSNLLPEPPKF
ncbi:hypothetical protein BV898_13759 [Hypsibius exemplaris]|uniref:CUB domain-containing protein n=1 Tax=Hypsibius exemplaris TaxID=2072580 RepID=A0A1W0W9S0_HYPEX|nr:hypothetical protein BV898_13759 [Hypsibius exemplaris]